MVYDPFDEVRRVLRAMERMFEDLFERPYEPWPTPTRGVSVFTTVKGFREPYTEVVDAGDEIIITAELPGVPKENIDLTVLEDRVILRAEIKTEEKKEEEGGVRITRGYTGFYKEIYLPVPVNPDSAKATYKNGILEIRIKKATTEKGKKVRVE